MACTRLLYFAFQMGGKGVKSALSSFGVLRGSLAAEQLSSDPPAFNLKENQAAL